MHAKSTGMPSGIPVLFKELKGDGPSPTRATARHPFSVISIATLPGHSMLVERKGGKPVFTQGRELPLPTLR
ncbi:MAG: hypothetical protein FJX89_07145 [Bacteroidetes bacterium]|nr:hypothetical protein [Bacteroidota bacterium]